MSLPSASALIAATLLASAPPAASEGPAPRLKWLSASGSLYLDRWGGTGEAGNGLSWRRKSVLYNPPQTLAYLNLGAGLALHPKAALSLAAPFYRNAIDAYTSSRSGLPVAGRSVSGLGDLEVAASLRHGPFAWHASFAAPWAYTAEFLAPWRGLGVHRSGLGGSWSAGPHGLHAAVDLVVHKPDGEKPGLVEPLDYALKGGYAWKRRLAPRLGLRAGADLSYTSYSWAGDRPQENFSLDPRLGFSCAAAPGHEISLSAAGTLYSHQGGSRTYHTYASRRLAFAVAYGHYR